ncbi:TlpA family protein disulfide reductase [Chitinophaga costaii]|nr:TlpA disulfide reductase family protein [Chitinophaga costaii]
MISTIKFRIIIWAFIGLCLVACSHKKKYVIIQGKLIGYHKGDSVIYFKPIDGFNNSQIFETTNIINDSGEFKIVFPSDSIGFTKIQTKKGNIFILAQNGDSVYSEQQTIPYADSFAMQPVIFTGSNSAMHNLYNKMNSNYFYKFNYAMDLLVKKYPAGSNLYDTLLSGINKYLLPFDSIYKQKKISKYCLEIMKSDFRNAMFWHVYHNMGALEKNNLWIVPEPEKDLKRDILQHSINVDPFLLHTNFGTGLLADFVGEYNELFRNQDYPVYDTFFYKNGLEYKASAHLIPGYNKFFWADMIIFKTLQNQEYGFSFDTIFSHLKNTFPGFTYIKIIEHLKKVNESNLNKSSAKINSNIHLIDSTRAINSLDKAIKTHFKDTAVYIDLWATWCMPCKEEFRYKNQLNNLLKEKNIKLMYISLDDTSKKNTWEQNIQYFDLEGYHILAGKNISNDIAKRVYGHEIVQSIPRYLLVNKQGKFVSMNMSRPSDLVTLKNELDSLLSKN